MQTPEPALVVLRGTIVVGAYIAIRWHGSNSRSISLVYKRVCQEASTVLAMAPIGVVTSSRTVPGDDDWDRETTVIRLADEFDESALWGLDTFSHIEVVYVFDRVAADKIEAGARRPRGNPDWPQVGIFAQRAKNRPNRIGVTTCTLLSVDGREIAVRGLDAIDGTPVIDIKPYLKEFGPRGQVRQPEWATELMQRYWD
jgi:tRNA-Thr(GGU) m(6)t(6)A37 methyltransferase TsaA